MTQTVHNPQYFSTCVWYVILIFSTILINYILGLLHYTQYNLKKHCIQLKIWIFLVVKHSMLRPAKVLKKVPIFRWKIKQIKNTFNSWSKTFLLILFLSFFARYLWFWVCLWAYQSLFSPASSSATRKKDVKQLLTFICPVWSILLAQHFSSAETKLLPSALDFIDNILNTHKGKHCCIAFLIL